MLRVTEKDGFKDLKYFGNNVGSGDVVYVLTGDIKNKPTQTSIQIGPNQHIEDLLGQYVNHSCYPTVKVVGNNLVAINTIINKDSITFDYNVSEDEMSNPFLCHCCGKKIKGSL